MRYGVKAHWRDVDTTAALAREVGAAALEVHTADRDAHADRARVVAAFAPLAREFALVVHAPEWCAPNPARPHAFFVNAAAASEPWRRESEDALVAAADLAREIGARGMVVHPGGADPPGRAALASVDALRRTLGAVRDRVPGVPLWIENMPWFYGHRDGGVARSFLGQRPEHYEPLADVVDGFTLDTCHAFLAEPLPGGGWPAVDRFLDAWGARIRHAHASGARRHAESAANPRSGEGLPFNEGEMDAATYARALTRLPADVAVVPEVEDGHLAGARGFRDAFAWMASLPP